MSLKKIIRVGPLVAWIAMVLAGGCGDDGNGNPGGSNSGSGSQFNPNINYGSLTDSRDGKTYKTVTIGTQTWMAENLNYDPGTGNSWCYNNSPDSCAKYGRLYDWSTAMGISTSYNSTLWSGSDVNHQGVCPSGWHLPSNAEWTTLVNYVGSNAGTKLKSAVGWLPYSGVPVGTDEYGFSALPGGPRWSDGRFINAGYNGYWWTATEYDATSAYYRGMYYIGEIVDSSWRNKSYGFSARCVRDD